MSRNLFRKAAPVFLLGAALQLHAASIRVDLNATQGEFHPIYNWFGYDEPNYTYMRHGTELLAELHDLTPAPVYIRTHNLLTTGDGTPDLKWGSTNAYTEDASGKPVYSWTIIDRIFDAYAAAHVRPMVEIGFMPEALSSRPQPYRIPFPGDIYAGWSYPPRDYQRWGELVRRFTEHLVERYGRSEAETWWWEVWNEPDIAYWHGTPEEYFRLYDFAVEGVRRALPRARVGGPATTGPHAAKAAAFLDAFLEHCAGAPSVPLDFISFHVKGRPSLVDGHVRMGLDHQLQDASDGFAIVSRFPKFQKLPIILSESDPEGCAACSARTHPQNAYRNGPLYASYTAAAMKGLTELADRHGVNLLGMLTWAFEFEGQPYFEGFRTLATNGVDKPVLNFFRMAGLMAGNRVRVNSSTPLDGLATRAKNEATVMIWNYSPDDIAAEPEPADVVVEGLPQSPGRVLLQHYRIDENHGNAFSAWKRIGSPQNPTPEQTAQLRAAGQLQLLKSPTWTPVDRGTVRVQFLLPRQGISLLRFTW